MSTLYQQYKPPIQTFGLRAEAPPVPFVKESQVYYQGRNWTVKKSDSNNTLLADARGNTRLVGTRALR